MPAIHLPGRYRLVPVSLRRSRTLIALTMLTGLTACTSGVTSRTAAAHSPESASTNPVSSGPSATVSPSVSVPAPTLPSTPALTAIMLQSTDLPATWQGAPYQRTPADATDQATLASCVGGTDTTGNRVAEAYSAEFILGNTVISSQARNYKSRADLAADEAILANPKASACSTSLYRSKLTSTLPPGSTIESLSVIITPGASGGPANVIATAAGTATFSTAGKKVTVYANVAFIVGPLIEAQVDFEKAGAPVSKALRRTLTAAVAARAATGGP